MRAVVTGAASGIGKATALLLADAGREVVAVDKDVHGLASLTAGGYDSQTSKEVERQNVHRCVADVSTPEGTEELKKIVGDEAVDIIVHCAGHLVSRPIMALDIRKFDRLMNSTIIAPVLVVQALLPNLKKANGARIILTTGGANKTYVPSLGAYGASTGALKQIWKALRVECKEFADVGLCLPGIVMTPAWEPYLQDYDWPFQSYFSQRLVEGGDCHQPSEVAEWYAALLDKQKVDSETFTQTEFNIDDPKHQYGVKVTLTSEGRKIVGQATSDGMRPSMVKEGDDSAWND